MSEPFALIETIGIRNGSAPLLRLHQNRLDRSSEALGLASVTLDPPLDRDGIVSCRVRGGVAEYRWRARPRSAPVRLATAPDPLRPYSHKTSDRNQFEVATAWAQAGGADEALILAGDGLVAESGIRAVCWWEGQGVAGPPLALGILPSVARLWLVENGVEVVEREVRRAEIVAKSPFLMNAARGVVEVASLDGEPVRPHLGTAALAALFRS